MRPYRKKLIVLYPEQFMKKVKVKAKDVFGRPYIYYKYIDEQNELSIGAIGDDRDRDGWQRNIEENGTREIGKSSKISNPIKV